MATLANGYRPPVVSALSLVVLVDGVDVVFSICYFWPEGLRVLDRGDSAGFSFLEGSSGSSRPEACASRFMQFVISRIISQRIIFILCICC